MKIIRAGVLTPENRNRLYRGECHRCHCVAEFEENELLPDQKKLSRECAYAFVKCPQDTCPSKMVITAVI